MAKVALTYSYIGALPTFGISYEVPNSKPPSICRFAWDWTAYDANFFNDVRINNDTVTMHCNIPPSGVSGAGLDMVKSVYIDNSQNYFPVTVTALDTQYEVYCGPLQSGWFPIATNQFNFDVKTFVGITTVLPIGVTTAPMQIVFCNTVVPPSIASATTDFDVYNKLDVLHQDLLSIEQQIQELINIAESPNTFVIGYNNAVAAGANISNAAIPALPGFSLANLTGFNIQFNLTVAESCDFLLQDATSGALFTMFRGAVPANSPVVYNCGGMNYTLNSAHAYNLLFRNLGTTTTIIQGTANLTYNYHN